MSDSPYTFDSPDADIILRAPLRPDDPESAQFQDFHTHKAILSTASTVFHDMFSVPQPRQSAEDDANLPVVHVVEPAEIFEIFLRLIYPIELPTRLPTDREPPLPTFRKIYDKWDSYETQTNSHLSFLPEERSDLGLRHRMSHGPRRRGKARDPPHLPNQPHSRHSPCPSPRDDNRNIQPLVEVARRSSGGAYGRRQ